MRLGWHISVSIRARLDMTYITLADYKYANMIYSTPVIFEPARKIKSTRSHSNMENSHSYEHYNTGEHPPGHINNAKSDDSSYRLDTEQMLLHFRYLRPSTHVKNKIPQSVYTLGPLP